MSFNVLLRASQSFLSIAVGCALVAGGSLANAADLTWGGTYRVEAFKFQNPELGSSNFDKSYLLHHLVLTPKVVAADGITIFGRLDVLNNSSMITPDGRIYSVAGDFFGNGPGDTTAATNENESNAWGRAQRAGLVGVTQLYGTWTHEFGQLIVGRTPMQFGLGTAFNAGNGLFDHYIDTKDIIGYKLVLGNLFVLPMLGKGSEGLLGKEDDVNDYMVHVQYDNPESELSLGGLYQLHVATGAGSDAPVGPLAPGDATATAGHGYTSNLIGLFFSQKIGSSLRFGLEADLLSGKTGVRRTNGEDVSRDAFGLAAELDWAPADSKWSAGVKAGLASGDDPGTTTYEGFAFSRNYDVAMLLFNHPMGQRDFLRTGVVRPTQSAGDGSEPVLASNQIDTEAISNVIYVAPSLQYRQNDKFAYGATFAWGTLNKDPLANGTSKNLGFELDLNVTYKPFERFTWITGVGALLPGDAWKGGSDNLDNDFAYAFSTKAAISF